MFAEPASQVIMLPVPIQRASFSGEDTTAPSNQVSHSKATIAAIGMVLAWSGQYQSLQAQYDTNAEFQLFKATMKLPGRCAISDWQGTEQIKVIGQRHSGALQLSTGPTFDHSMMI